MQHLSKISFFFCLGATLYFSIFGLYAQGPNLVPNPSFELKGIAPIPFVDGKYPAINNNNAEPNPQALHYIMRGDTTLTKYRPEDYYDDDTSNRAVERWFRANSATSDYYHTDATVPIGYDANRGARIPYIWAADSLSPVTGDAYAGIAVKRVSGSNIADEYREYLAARLTQPLEQGKTYMVKFRYSMATYKSAEEEKSEFYKNKYYLKKLGVAFVDTTQPIYSRATNGFSTTYWTTQSSDYFTNTLEFDSAGYQMVENNNLGYYEAPLWGEFIEHISPNQSGLKYIIIGNFDQQISLFDIIRIKGRNGITPNSLGTYPFYFLIDDVEVREVANPDSCECKYIFTCPHTRNDSLENNEPGKCCFTTPIRPDPGACQFRFLRIKQGSTVVSDPPFIDFGGIVPKGTTVEASFCVDAKNNEDYTRIDMEFLDEDSNVVCIKPEYVYCNCPCYRLDEPIAPGVALQTLEPEITKIANAPNGDCCWEFSLKNNYSCDILDTSFTIEARAGNSTFTAVSPWQKITLGSNISFVKPGGMAANSSSLVFRVCTPPQTNGIPRVLEMNVKKEPTSNFKGSVCYSFPDVELECSADTNCCDLLEVILRKKSQTMSHDCEFDFIVRQKNGPKKCKFHRIRIKEGAITRHITDSTGTAMDLSQETVIWEDDLGTSCPQSLTPGYQRSATYTIEFLDSTGTVLCPVTKTFQCCYSSGVSSGSKMGMQEQSKNIKELTSGGAITNAVLNGKRLQYTVQNKGETIPAKVQIIGLSGEVFQTVQSELKNGTNAGEMDISRLPNGTYYISVQTSLWQTSKQIIIMK